MKQILCYGDSNTFGANPHATDAKHSRFPWDKRWTGLLQMQLGQGYRVIEEGLGGRTTMFPDRSSEGRNGLQWLCPCLQTHQPLDLVLIMLGTNDTKVIFSAPVEEIARGIEALVKIAKNPFATDKGESLEVLVVSPILVGDDVDHCPLAGTFDQSSVEKSKNLARVFREVAEKLGCHFFDAASVAAPAVGESIHMDEAAHCALAHALAGKILTILG